MDTRKIQYWEEQVDPTCCPGYAENPARRCVPICLDACRNGKCVQPNICQCDPQPTDSAPGFVGPTCSRFSCLDENKWGPSCNNECNCSPNSYCHATTGKCICKANWRGQDCLERCNSTSDCAETLLLPVIEPEANMIPGSLVSADKLVIERDSEGLNGDNDNASTIASFALTQSSIIMFLVFLTSLLVIVLVWQRKRLNQLRNQLYSSIASNGSSTTYDQTYYSAETVRSLPIHQRPRMPTPDEANQLSKNLSFAAATRNIVKGLDTGRVSNQNGLCNELIFNPKIESHLITSQVSSQENIYSEIQSNQDENPVCTLRVPQGDDPAKPNDSTTLNVNINYSTNDTSHYQVPRSPSNADPKISFRDDELN